MDQEFDVYKYYSQGWTAGFLTPELLIGAWEVIESTDFVYAPNGKGWARWMLLPEDQEGSSYEDTYYEELLRSRVTFYNSPTDIKAWSYRLLASDFFRPFVRSLSRPQHGHATWMKGIRPSHYDVIVNQGDLDFHSDWSSVADFMILCYFSQEYWDDAWGGHIKLATEDQQGKITEIHRHAPMDGTFVVINNRNPYFLHGVDANDQTHPRYSFNIHCRIER